MNWQLPSSCNEVKRYLGLINYFRDFILLYSTLAAPLERMRKMPRITAQDWTSDRIKAFESLRDVFVSSTILSHPDFSKPFSVATDASNVGIGAVLYQLRDDQAEDIVSNRQWIRCSCTSTGRVQLLGHKAIALSNRFFFSLISIFPMGESFYAFYRSQGL
jgi:hypothetical protein